ncbi:MAG: transcription termination factor Rho [Eubacteriales bacterium]|nr:transcription termination factor Rho [Eubacteriales bacterium]
MPKKKFAGKTKEDLVQIAVMSDLLIPSQARKLSKAKLLGFLEEVEEVVAAGGDIKAWLEEQVGPNGKHPDIPPRRPPGRPPKKTKAETQKKSKKQAEQQRESAKVAPEAESEAVQSPEKAAALKKTLEASKVSKRSQESIQEAKEKAKAKKLSEAKAAQSTAERFAEIAAEAPQESALDSVADEASKKTEEGRKLRAHDLLKRQRTRTLRTSESDSEQREDKAEKSRSYKHEKRTSNRAKTQKQLVEERPEQDSEKADTAEQGAPDKTSEREQRMVTGILEMMPDGYGFLRLDNYLQGPNDIYVPPQYIRRFKLRPGDEITGPSRSQRDNDRYEALYYIKSVNGRTPDKMIKRPRFDSLTPIYPNERLKLETGSKELSTRIIDLISPIGKGQRGMIVSPPKAGKTILLQKIANAIKHNNPEAKLIVLLIDERPEEVTDMQRSIDGEVVYSTFDKTPENHVKVTELVLERAMRLVELGDDVIILLDSITRMARAYNLTVTPSGRTLSGGVDPAALYGPKRFFGAARNIEFGGSLTIVATALVDTGSRMDELIFEEFKGTGNMEVVLDRKIAEKRVFPAIDVLRSSTRREELLLDPDELEAVWSIRRAFSSMEAPAVTETLLNLMRKTRDNIHFADTVNKSFTDQSVFEKLRSDAHAGGKSGNSRERYYHKN